MTFITNMHFKFVTNIFKIPIMTKHKLDFDALVLLMSIPSETSTFSCCTIFITHTNTHLNKFVDKLTIFFKNKPNNYCQHVHLQQFIQWHIIIYVKFNFHEIFTIFAFFTTVYCFNFIFNAILKFCVFMSILHCFHLKNQKLNSDFNFFIQEIHLLYQ